MPELTSFQDALATINRLFKPSKAIDKDTSFAEDYAKIAWFLTSKNGEFEEALKTLSLLLWKKYRVKQQGAQKNVFTSALREVATDFGWAFGANIDVVLVGAVSAQQYETWVRQGLFFKDDMDLQHGEHSHTFQWLAVTMNAHKISLKNDPHVLYKTTFDMLNNNKDVVVPGFKSPDGKTQGPGAFSLWSFIVNSFPTTMAASNAMPQGDSLFSNTFRTPQKMMEYLLNKAPEDHFIAGYLRNRYKRRNWFTDSNFTTYEKVSIGATAKNYATAQLARAPGVWTPIAGPGGNQSAAFTKTAAGPLATQPKKMIQVKFHGETGLLADPGVH